ncbi:metacaspase-1 isoform X2 [Jatropha curcas]|uniref:metacaspase-1 isoform X2 n=1 Tax=Jatropha curcas TaxID=180498 RepID=UPI0009D6729E|nr:metacaspase-1 isoform X2 [Jatropha curcas]
MSIESDKNPENNNTNHARIGKILRKTRSVLKLIKSDQPCPLDVPKSPERPRKFAVLIAVSYRGQKYELKGTINDVKRMKKWLIGNFEFKPKNILILTEDEKDKRLKPTKENIQNSMKWLVKDCREGDSLVFYFSGHGLRQPDFDEDERDGWDETICPVDFDKAGMILDNEINATIVRPLPKGVVLHAIVDACHSGTVLDLPYVYNRDRKCWDDNRPPSGVYKSTIGGLAIGISACRDDQMAADTDKPQLSSSEPFNIYQKPFVL